MVFHDCLQRVPSLVSRKGQTSKAGREGAEAKGPDASIELIQFHPPIDLKHHDKVVFLGRSQCKCFLVLWGLSLRARSNSCILCGVRGAVSAPCRAIAVAVKTSTCCGCSTPLDGGSD
jgi:hypothetical protein